MQSRDPGFIIGAVTSFLRPKTHEVLAEVVLAALNTGYVSHLAASPVFSQLSKFVVKPLLLDHGQVSLPPLPLASIMVPHSPGHLLIVHLLRSVGLHAAPRLGKLQGVCDLKAAGLIVHPGDNTWIVARVVKQVADEDVERRKWKLGRVLARPSALSFSGS